MTDSDTPSERDLALRELLVATATAATAAGAQPRRRRVGVIALALAGLLVGGAAGAAITAAANPGAPASQADADAAIWVKAGVAEYDTVVGTPQAIVGSGARALKIGAAPPNATLFSWAARCLSGEGTLTMRYGNEPSAPFACDGTQVHFGEHPAAKAAAGKTLHISSTGRVRWVLYYGWVVAPSLPSASSAEKDAVADGLVTRSEYVDAFNRFAGCMNGRGDPVIVPETTLAFVFGVTDEAALDWCYAAEFQDVDVLWQTEHPAPDGTDSSTWDAQPYDSLSDPLYDK